MGDKYRVFVKGAPEIVIQRCTKVIGEGGKIQSLSEQDKSHTIDNVVVGYAGRCLRALLMSYRDFSEAEWAALNGSQHGWKNAAFKEEVENDLTMVGVLALKDPLRDGIRKAVETCHKAGINVRMVTGDNINTAKAISVEAGIISQADLANNEDLEYLCMEGPRFTEAVQGKLEFVEGEEEVEGSDGEKETKKIKKVVCKIGNMNKFRQIEKQLKVMARSQPDDKFMLVDGLIKIGRTVAVTGDGTNDAPALNRSDVGFAMGITGTDVAKNACDITLLDDNFCSILTAVRYGRNIYDNVRKFLQF